jgi:hypothetical protein
MYGKLIPYNPHPDLQVRILIEPEGVASSWAIRRAAPASNPILLTDESHTPFQLLFRQSHAVFFFMHINPSHLFTFLHILATHFFSLGSEEAFSHNSGLSLAGSRQVLRIGWLHANPTFGQNETQAENRESPTKSIQTSKIEGG